MKPIQFIAVGARVSVLFKDDRSADDDDREKWRWYTGEVTKVFPRDDSDEDCAIVDIQYDDGEVENETRLYNSDYESSDGNAWRFEEGNLAALVNICCCRARRMPASHEIVPERASHAGDSPRRSGTNSSDDQSSTVGHIGSARGGGGGGGGACGRCAIAVVAAAVAYSMLAIVVGWPTDV